MRAVRRPLTAPHRERFGPREHSLDEMRNVFWVFTCVINAWWTPAEELSAEQAACLDAAEARFTVNAIAEPTTAPEPDVFTAADRCDRCSAQASVKATKDYTGQLLFCGHHGRKFGEALREKGWTVA